MLVVLITCISKNGILSSMDEMKDLKVLILLSISPSELLSGSSFSSIREYQQQAHFPIPTPSVELSNNFLLASHIQLRWTNSLKES